MTEKRKQQHPRGKDYRKPLDEWMERSAKVLEEYGSKNEKSS